MIHGATTQLTNRSQLAAQLIQRRNLRIQIVPQWSLRIAAYVRQIVDAELLDRAGQRIDRLCQIGGRRRLSTTLFGAIRTRSPRG
jgi:hypothetical protein